MRALIAKAKKEIKVNIGEEIQEIEGQIKMNEEWEVKVRAIVAEEDYSRFKEAKELLEEVWNDKEENYTMIDKKEVREL